MAVVELALSPKSNNAYMALDRAIADINDPEIDTTIPMHLRDAHYKGADKMGVVGYAIHMTITRTILRNSIYLLR